MSIGLGNSRPVGQPPASQETQRFSTDTLHFASWLITDGLLRYERCTQVGRRIRFYFFDPENRGPALNAQWQSSNPLVPIKTFNEVIRMLRAEMTAVQTGVRG